MPKYRVIFEGEPEDRLYDTYEDAEEAALYSCSCSREGEEILHMSNPGDYDYDEFDENYEYEYEIEEVNDSDIDYKALAEGLFLIGSLCVFIYKKALKPAYKFVKQKIDDKFNYDFEKEWAKAEQKAKELEQQIK